MDATVFETTLEAVFDALSLSGPTEDGGGFVRTTDPAAYMSAQRLQLARAVAERLPAGTTAATAERVAHEMVPFVRSMLQK